MHLQDASRRSIAVSQPVIRPPSGSAERPRIAGRLLMRRGGGQLIGSRLGGPLSRAGLSRRRSLRRRPQDELLRYRRHTFDPALLSADRFAFERESRLDLHLRHHQLAI